MIRYEIDLALFGTGCHEQAHHRVIGRELRIM
jgi:hypothetical protein